MLEKNMLHLTYKVHRNIPGLRVLAVCMGFYLTPDVDDDDDDDDELFLQYGYRRKAFSLISSRNHCRKSSPSWISDTQRAGFEPAQNLSLGLVE